MFVSFHLHSAGMAILLIMAQITSRASAHLIQRVALISTSA